MIKMLNTLGAYILAETAKDPSLKQKLVFAAAAGATSGVLVDELFFQFRPKAAMKLNRRAQARLDEGGVGVVTPGKKDKYGILVQPVAKKAMNG